MKQRSGYDPAKRAFDFIAASIIFAVTLPIQAVIAVLIRAKLGSPVLFTQNRPGLNGETFELRKFRTMRDAAPGDGSESDGARLTLFGQKLRALSLDELPTLLNVIRGDMSLVGPRPLLVEYLPRYDQFQARRHEVRPGITGLAQVSGRNAISWEQKFEFDVEYVDKRSLRLDIAILFRTIAPVVTSRDISSDDSATMTEFRGNSNDA